MFVVSIGSGIIYGEILDDIVPSFSPCTAVVSVPFPLLSHTCVSVYLENFLRAVEED